MQALVHAPVSELDSPRSHCSASSMMPLPHSALGSSVVVPVSVLFPVSPVSAGPLSPSPSPAVVVVNDVVKVNPPSSLTAPVVQASEGRQASDTTKIDDKA